MIFCSKFEHNQNKMKGKKLTFIDLFAGCGGLSEGFLQSGKFEGLAHVEWEKPMVTTLRNRLVEKWNHTDEEAMKSVIHFDIQKTDELINGEWKNSTVTRYGESNHTDNINSGLRGLIGTKKVDAIIGGPPCQAYSIAGRAQDKDSMQYDYRNYLFESFVEVVDEFKPEVFVFENVQGLLSAKPGGKPVTKRIFEAFNKIGYSIKNPEELKDALYSSADFGVAQNRKRVIIIGVKKDSVTSHKEIYKTINKLISNIPAKTVKEVISHLPKLTPLAEPIKSNGKNLSHSENGGLEHHTSRFHNERDVKIFRRWVSEKMNLKSPSEKIDFYNKMMKKKSNHAKYRNLEWDKQSPTIVAHLYKDGLMFIHPDVDQARSITVKEAALLQSFPDDFRFKGSTGSAYKMIGNAVPPKMAEHIAIAISKCIKGEK